MSDALPSASDPVAIREPVIGLSSFQNIEALVPNVGDVVWDLVRFQTVTGDIVSVPCVFARASHGNNCYPHILEIVSGDNFTKPVVPRGQKTLVIYENKGGPSRVSAEICLKRPGDPNDFGSGIPLDESQAGYFDTFIAAVLKTSVTAEAVSELLQLLPLAEIEPTLLTKPKRLVFILSTPEEHYVSAWDEDSMTAGDPPSLRTTILKTLKRLSQETKRSR